EIAIEVGEWAKIGIPVVRVNMLEEHAGAFGLWLTRGGREKHQDHFPSPIFRICFHSSSRTGETERRDSRISSILASFGSALISFSVTGPSGRTGSTATETQSGSFGSGCASRVM